MSASNPRPRAPNRGARAPIPRGAPVRPSDRATARSVERWFAANARPLPWRPSEPGIGRDPWASLVSEVMLQQTQASRVAARLPGYLAAFPTPRALADASEDAALAAWSGLGYYRRARLLRECAKEIVGRHGGRVPASAGALRELPGIGAYTAGAVASIVFGAREAAVDANIIRVILRLEGRALTATSAAARALAWDRARALVGACRSPTLLNEGLMELGALVCTPRRPRCAQCPLAGACRARARGAQERIPAPRAPARKATLHHAAALVRTGGRTLVQRRPTSDRASGSLWAGLWQPPTLERADRAPTASEMAAWLGVRRVRLVDRFVRTLTHRRVEFTVWEAPRPGALPPGWSFKTGRQLRALGLASPHARILLRGAAVASRPRRGKALDSPPR